MDTHTKHSKDEVANSSQVQPESTPLNSITIWPLNPRAESEADVSGFGRLIAKQGLVQKIILRQRPDGRYEVIIGSRRLRAIRDARGPDGILRGDEFRVVDWDDAKCLRATWAENEDRVGLSPLEEGKHLERLADSLSENSKPLSEEKLAKRLNLSRQRVNDARDLARKFSLLPKAWQDCLSQAPCRSSDNGRPPSITATHWKKVRTLVDDNSPDWLPGVLDATAKERWSAAKLARILNKHTTPTKKKAAKKTDKTPPQSEAPEAPKNPSHPADPNGPNTPQPKDEVHESSVYRAVERDPNKDPDYNAVAHHLINAYECCGSDDETAGRIEEILESVEEEVSWAMEEQPTQDA